MMKMTELSTLGKDQKNYNFRYTQEDYFDSSNDINKLLFFVYSADEDYDDYFDFKIAPLEHNIIKITDMFLDSKKYLRGRGIPEAMILEMHRLFPNHQIISSSNNDNFKRLIGEWRSLEGSAVWNRLVKNNLAIYNSEEDLYYLNGKKNITNSCQAPTL